MTAVGTPRVRQGLILDGPRPSGSPGASSAERVSMAMVSRGGGARGGVGAAACSAQVLPG